MASLVSFLLVLYFSIAVIPSVNMDESLGERDNWVYHSHSDNYTNKKFLRIIMLHVSRLSVYNRTNDYFSHVLS